MHVEDLPWRGMVLQRAGLYNGPFTLDTDAQLEAEVEIRTLEELRLQKVCRKEIPRKEFYVPSS